MALEDKMKEVSQLSTAERLERARQYRKGLITDQREAVQIKPETTVDEFIDSILTAFESIPDEHKQLAEVDPKNMCIYYGDKPEQKPTHNPKLEQEIKREEASIQRELRGGNVGGFQGVRGVDPKNAHIRG